MSATIEQTIGELRATLVSYIIKGILSHKLPWALVLFGVMISIVLELCAIPSLAFAVGVYLPLATSMPVFIGGAVRWFVDAKRRRQADYAQALQKRLVEAGIRATLDDRKEKVNLKIRDAQMQKIPYMLVVGDREAQNESVSVRNRKHGDQGVKTVDEFLAAIRQLITNKTPAE